MKRLRINHFPQIPCKGFVVEVKNLEEAKKIYNVLADYDMFQYENRIKPDYCNVTSLEEYCEKEKEWYDWYDEETGLDFREYIDMEEEME